MISKAATGTILLIILIEFGIGFFVPRSEFLYQLSRPLDDDEFRFAHRLISEPGAVFIVGSSQAREDYDTEALSEKLGVSVKNLGLSGASFLDWYMLSGDLIEEEPSTIIFTTYIGDINGSMIFNPLRFDIGKGIEVARGDIFAMREGMFRGLVAEILPSFRYRDIFSHAMYRSLGGNTEYVEYGAIQNPPEYFKNELQNAKVRHTLSSDAARQREMFLKFARDIHEKGITLIIVRGPLYPGFERFVDPALEDYYTDTLMQASEEFGAVYVKEEELPRFSPSDFADFTHLNSVGRAKMTERIAQLIPLQ